MSNKTVLAMSSGGAATAPPTVQVQAAPKPRPAFTESLSQAFQVWALRRHRVFSKVFVWLAYPILRIITFYEGVKANGGDYLYHKRAVFGSNFCCAGGVWLGEFQELERALTEPQARGFKLASSALDPEHLPNASVGGRNVFLLSLSQKGAGGNGDWEAFRAAMEDHITHTTEAASRQNDQTTAQLLNELVDEYKKMGHSKDFFENPDRGLLAFLMRYLHYVLFGLDPNDKKKMEALTNLHYDSSAAAYHLKVVGNVFQALKFRKWPQQIQDVAKIYAESPSLAKFEEGNPKYNNMTKHELSMLMVSIMALAGMIGPLTLAVIVLGHRPLNDYEGHETAKIDVTKEWDQLDLNNRDEVMRYMLECGRLRNPVSNSHRIATEDFTVKIRGVDRTFSEGTVIYIPMLFGGLNEAEWGPTTYKFDHNRKNLCPYSMIFQSVGDRTNGRICPGKQIAIDMLTKVVVKLGKVRRADGMTSPSKVTPSEVTPLF